MALKKKQNVLVFPWGAVRVHQPAESLFFLASQIILFPQILGTVFKPPT